jgi:two-component sensor histidine kinase
MRWRPPVWLALFVVGLAAATPAIVYSLLVIREAYDAQRDRVDQAALQHTRAVALRLDRELASRIELLRGLALSPALAQDDLFAFHEYAVTAAKAFDYGWIVLIDPDGQQLVNTLRPFGSYLVSVDPDIEDRIVFSTRAPHVSGLFIGRTSGEAVASIAVPVVQDGVVTHVLSFRAPPQTIAKRIWGQDRPLGILAVVDGSGTVIARSERPEFIGQPASAAFRDAMARGMRDGIIDFTTLEGIRSFGAMGHSSLSGWFIGLAVDQAVLLAPLRSQIMWLAGVGAGALAVAGLLTYYFAGRISRDVHLLSHASQVLAAGRKPPIREDGFVTREFATIADAMLRAGARLVERTQRAEQLAEERAMLVREVHHRVKNNLQMVTGLIQLQRQGMDSGGREAMAGLSRRIGEIAALHEQLYRGRQPDRIDFVEYLNALCERLATVTDRQIVCDSDPAFAPTMPVDVAIPLGLLVNELITNAAKHGGRAGVPIEVSLRRGADGRTYALSVTDDGPGLPPDAANGASLGMRLITALASQLQAQLRFDSAGGRGTRVELLLREAPPAPPAAASDL